MVNGSIIGGKTLNHCAVLLMGMGAFAGACTSAEQSHDDTLGATSDALPADSGGEWWKHGPTLNADPMGSQPVETSADVACDYEDPFFELISCRASCYFALVRVSNRQEASDSYVMSAVDGGYVVLDTTIANAEIDEYLTHPVHFEGAPFGHPPQGPVTLQQYPTGFMDLYSVGEADSMPSYVRTIWSTVFVLPSSATLVEGRAILGFRSANDVLEPQRLMATLVLPVSDDGLVDMRAFKGTVVQSENGWPQDTPMEMVQLDEARRWFASMLPYSVVRCFPDEVDPPSDAVWPPSH